jgi:hypothetical protein
MGVMRVNSRSLLRMACALVLLAGFPSAANALKACKAKMDKRTGVIQVFARDADQTTLRWGAEAGSENLEFFDDACIRNGKAKKCLLADPETLSARTPPDACTLYLADADGSCSAWVQGCTPARRAPFSGCRTVETPAARMDSDGISNTLTLTAQCAADEVAVSGGFDIGSFFFPSTCVPFASKPTPDGRGWTVSWYSPPNNCQGNSFSAIARCCRE